MIRINEIRLNLDEEEELLKAKAAKVLKINQKYVKSLSIYKKSVDARKKDDKTSMPREVRLIAPSAPKV